MTIQLVKSQHSGYDFWQLKADDTVVFSCWDIDEMTYFLMHDVELH